MDSGELEFAPYSGDFMGLTVTPDHVVFRWNVNHCTILFSLTQQGQSANCHFASDKAGLRHIRTAIDKFVRFVFSAFDWCRMVIANVQRPSVARIVEKVGFKWVASVQGMQIYARAKEWAE